MPTYQYACTNPDCGNRFELVQSFTDAAVAECPVCGQPVRKVYGSVGVVFKGSGFYRTDSRAAASASTAPSSSNTSKSESRNGTTPKDDSSSKPSTSGSGTTTKTAAST